MEEFDMQLLRLKMLELAVDAGAEVDDVVGVASEFEDFVLVGVTPEELDEFLGDEEGEGATDWERHFCRG